MKHIDLSFGKIVNGMLNEAGVYDAPYYLSKIFKDINYAITNQCYITLNYDDGRGDDGMDPAYGNPRGIREVIPYCLGTSKRNGRLVLRPYHTSPNHTKKGPYKWKYMYLDKMKNVRVARNRHFTLEDIPSDANPTGDKFMSRIINIVGMNKADREEAMRYTNEKGEFIDPLTRVKQNPQNEPGAISKPKTKNINSLANLNMTPKQNNGEKAPKYDYKAAQRNMRDFNLNDTEAAKQQRFADWDKAEAELKQQNTQNSINPPGPVNTTRQQQVKNPNVNVNKDEEEGWDEYLNRPNNNNF